MYTIDTYMYPKFNTAIEQLTLDLPQYFTPDEDLPATSRKLTEQQEAAMSQLLDIMISEFEKLYSECVQGDDECQNQDLQKLSVKLSSI